MEWMDARRDPRGYASGPPELHIGQKSPMRNERDLFRGRAAGSLVPVDDAPLSEIIGGHLHLHTIAREDADVVQSHLTGYVCGKLVSVVQLYLKHSVGQSLHDYTILLYCWFFCHYAFYLLCYEMYLSMIRNPYDSCKSLTQKVSLPITS